LLQKQSESWSLNYRQPISSLHIFIKMAPNIFNNLL
jgi:hypothetical protein